VHHLAEIADDPPPEELEAIFKATWWADNITNAKWPALLHREGPSRSARSKLKKKVISWWMALSRIAYLDPELYNQTVAEAKRLYLEQVREPHPCFRQSETDDWGDGAQD
jgi:hypothetical protein